MQITQTASAVVGTILTVVVIGLLANVYNMVKNVAYQSAAYEQNLDFYNKNQEVLKYSGKTLSRNEAFSFVVQFCEDDTIKINGVNNLGDIKKYVEDMRNGGPINKSADTLVKTFKAENHLKIEMSNTGEITGVEVKSGGVS